MRTLCKNLILLILGIFIMPLSSVNAKIPAEQVAIGGITYKASIDYIISIYGQPSRVKNGTIISALSLSFFTLLPDILVLIIPRLIKLLHVPRREIRSWYGLVILDNIYPVMKVV